MKELLAILVGIFTSLFNSLEYQPADTTKLYAEDAYYTIDANDSPDYREFYGSIYSNGDLSGCRTTNYDAQGKLIEGLPNNVRYQGYWLENGTTTNIDSDKLIDSTYEFKSNCYIIAPFDCTLVTDTNSNKCDTMVVDCEIDDVIYRLEFTDMERWYCDVSRTYSSDDKYHTSDNQKGKLFRAGDVLGVAQAGTSVKVTPRNDTEYLGTCTFQQMYLGEYTEN